MKVVLVVEVLVVMDMLKSVMMMVYSTLTPSLSTSGAASHIKFTTTTAQTGLVYKNFLLLYMREYKPVYSLVYELNLQVSLQLFVSHFNGDLGLYT